MQSLLIAGFMFMLHLQQPPSLLGMYHMAAGNAVFLQPPPCRTVEIGQLRRIPGPRPMYPVSLVLALLRHFCVA